jgi:hypothetical protein
MMMMMIDDKIEGESIKLETGRAGKPRRNHQPHALFPARCNSFGQQLGSWNLRYIYISTYLSVIHRPPFFNLPPIQSFVSRAVNDLSAAL